MLTVGGLGIEARNSGSTWFRTTWGNQRIAYKAGPAARQWFQYDARSSVIRTDPANTDVADGPAAYDPFGALDTPSGPDRTGYRGELTASDHIHLRNRDYDPATGQFTTQDPLDSIDGTPTVANPYHYTGNDPLNKVDPLGLRPCDGDFRLNGKCVFADDVPTRLHGLRHLYTVEFPLGQGTAADAERLVRRIRTNPNDYFPFTVRLARCGDHCDPPLSRGNVLSLESSSLLGDPGHVVVVSAGRTGWAFLALDDHIAAGGVVEFVIEASGGSNSTFSFKVIAWGAERVIEGRSPGFVASYFGRQTWSMFAAAIRCEQIYERQEQYRRC